MISLEEVMIIKAWGSVFLTKFLNLKAYIRFMLERIIVLFLCANAPCAS